MSPKTLLQPFQLPLAADDVLIVPLDVPSLGQPAGEVLGIDLFGGGVAGFGGFEAPLILQLFLVEGLATPKKEADGVLQFAIADDGVPLQKPDGMRVPDLILRLRQILIDLLGQQIRDLAIGGSEGLVVFGGVGVNRETRLIGDGGR